MTDQKELDLLRQIAEEKEKRDQAYLERNELVCALSKIFPAWLERHPEHEEWEDDWRWIVFIDIPAKFFPDPNISAVHDAVWRGQLTWHIHDSELNKFNHLDRKLGLNSWDGHDSVEKYRRLRFLLPQNNT